MRASKDARIYIQMEVILPTMLDLLPDADAYIYIILQSAAVRTVDILPDRTVGGGRMEESAVCFAKDRYSVQGGLS
jgi:hypothetical protein